MYLYRYPNCGVPAELDHHKSSYRQIFGLQYHLLVHCACPAFSMQELCQSSRCSHITWYLRSQLSAHLHCTFKHVVQERRAGSDRYILVRYEWIPTNCRWPTRLCLYKHYIWSVKVLAGSFLNIWKLFAHLGCGCPFPYAWQSYESQMLYWGRQKVDGWTCSK